MSKKRKEFDSKNKAMKHLATPIAFKKPFIFLNYACNLRAGFYSGLR